MKKTFPENPINPFPPSSFHISNEGTIKKTTYLSTPLPLNNKKIKNQGAPFQVPPLHNETQ
jgi:hypothetical protein